MRDIGARISVVVREQFLSVHVHQHTPDQVGIAARHAQVQIDQSGSRNTRPSLLVGIAIGEGLIGSVDQGLAELLPDRVPTMAPGSGLSRFGSC